MRGTPDLAAGSAATKVSGEAAGDGLGSAVATGDVDGDGTPDLLLGAAGWDVDGTTTNVGRAYFFEGGTLIASMAAAGADAIYTGESVTDERFGAAVSAVDLDDDGSDDLVVGAPENDGGGVDAGRVHVFLGTATPADTAATADDLTFTGAAAGDRFGGGLPVGP